MSEERFLASDGTVTRETSRLIACLSHAFRELQGTLFWLTGMVLIAIGLTISGKESWLVEGLGAMLIILGGNRVYGE